MLEKEIALEYFPDRIFGVIGLQLDKLIAITRARTQRRAYEKYNDKL